VEENGWKVNFPWRTGLAMRRARRWRGSVGDQEACQGIVVGGGWPEGYSSRLSMVMAVGFAMAMMFRHTGIEEARWGKSRSFLKVLWSCLGDWRGIEAAGRCGLMGRDDRAGLGRYANSSANLKVLLLTGWVSFAHARVLLKHGRHTRVASCRIATPGRISCVLFSFCSHTTGS
jgi:hypothetical protein